MRHFAFFSLILLGLFACNNRIDKVTQPRLESKSKFAVIHTTILQPKCVRCHSGATGHVNLTSYQTIMEGNLVIPKKPGSSRLLLAIENDSMPKGESPLSKEERALISQWIEEGARELDPQSGEGPLPNPHGPNANFKWISKNIFQPRCVVCHNLQKPRGKVDLSSYQGLMSSPGKDGKKPIALDNPLKSTVLIEIDEQKMPPDIKKLNAEETKALHDWLLAGAPNSMPSPMPTPTPSPAPPTPPEPTYGWLSKNLFSRRCGSCHGIPFTVANVDFTSYATLMNSEGKLLRAVMPGEPTQSGIYQEVIKGHMPPPRKLVTADERAVILEWIQAGAPNNE